MGTLLGWRRSALVAAVIGTLASASVAGAASNCFGLKKATTMTGAAEVPPGDLVGSGRAVIGLNVQEGLVCWSLTTRGIEIPSVGHVHRGLRGEAGPPVVTWTLAGRASKGCVAANRSLIRDIVRNPRRYYVNVHNTDHPGGALRGQLG